MTKHIYKTRLLHSIFAILIIIQLFSIYAIDNRFFTKPIRTFLFDIHKYGGLVTFAVLFLFWIFAFKRHQGTPVSELFPWLSRKALCDLLSDIIHHMKSILKFEMPVHTNPAPLASAIHGLGVIIMSVMATTGVHRFIVYQFSIEKTPIIKFFSGLHHVFADYAWIYLILHVSVAIINHISKRQALSEMWCLKK